MSTIQEFSESNSPTKAGFAHFMLKEIHDQPEVVRHCLATYLNPNWNHSHSPANLGIAEDWLTKVEQINILACGTSWHASLIGQYWLEQLAKIPTRVRTASEFVSAPFPITANTITIGVTQSGETADTLAAIEAEKSLRSGQPAPLQPNLLGITNQPDSALPKLVDYTLPTLAGTEIGVAATKTFVTQLVVFLCLTLNLAYQRQTISEQRLGEILQALRSIPEQIDTILKTQAEPLQQIAQTFANAQDFVILGRGINRAIALEGALKLKETTYIHAEGYAGGEFMHGPIAMLDANTPVIAIVPVGSVYSSILANAQKVKSNGAPLMGITNVEAINLFDHQITLPAIDEMLSPFLTVIPLQMLAYYIAVKRGLDVDKPRNITKTLV